MILGCSDVRYKYWRQKNAALEGASLELTPGITGLLGPNGAGKSTLLSVLTTLRNPTGGAVYFDGHPVDRSNLNDVRCKIGFLPQRFDLLGRATAQRNVAYAAWAHGVPADKCDSAADRALAAVGLSDKANHAVASLSGGQRQRVGIACAVAHEPGVVILDEPTAGLDPAQRVQLRSLLAVLAQSSVVLLSTHIAEDLALIEGRAIVLDHGKVVFSGDVSELAASGDHDRSQGISPIESGYLRLLDAAS